MIRETDLYAPIKRFLEDDGYEVKSEVVGCDVVACKSDAPTVIVELKVSFSLDLVYQGIARQKTSDDVYLAVPKPDTPAKRKNWRKKQRSMTGLCRRLGLGLMLVDIATGHPDRMINVLLDPASYTPRKNGRLQTRLKKEFLMRTGDPNTGGITRTKIITAYRQDAIRCAMALNGKEGVSVKGIRTTTGVPRAGAILQKNHYGWFERESRGVYRLGEAGNLALQQYAAVIAELS